MKASLAEIAALVQGEVVGDATQMITRFSPIDHIEAGALVYAEGLDNFKQAEASEAAAILVAQSFDSDKKTLIKVAEPFKAFITILQHYQSAPKPAAGIHPTAVIADDVQLGEAISIGPYVVIESGAVIADRCILKSHVHIGQNVHLGEESILHPQVTVYDNCKIGSRVIIHASSVIGSDGFGYKWMDGQHQKVPHVGHVVIGNDVEIGSNTSIDRATLGATIIGDGTKIDNHVQIAHSVKMGQHNIVCAFTGIAGSTSSGDHVVFAANVGVSDHVRIDSNVVLAARAGVPPKKHLIEGNVYLGSPARPKDKAIETELSVTRIPLMRKNMKGLSEKINDLNQRLTQLEAEVDS